MVARQLQEIIGLQDHVVEFKEGQRLFTVQPQLHRIERQHAVDGEMPPDIAQQLDIAELAQPVVIVDHDRVGRAVTERQEAFEHPADRSDVGVDAVIVEQLAAFILARRIADLGGAAAHDDDGLVPGLLQAAQQHDQHEVADME